MQTGFTYTADESLVMSFEPLPEGDYKVRIKECKYEPTSDKLGTNFNFKYEVTEGQYKNRQLFDSACWTWTADHQKAIDFGHVKFNQILLAIGHNHFAGDTDELLGYEMIVHVKKENYEKRDGSQGERNNVNGWKKISDGQNTVTNSAPQPTMAGPKPTFGGGSPIPRPTFGRS